MQVGLEMVAVLEFGCCAGNHKFVALEVVVK
jgi:hypothetical protein